MVKFAKLRKATISLVRLSFCLCLRPHGTTRFPLDGFPRNLIFEYFSIICKENLSSLKSGQNKGYFTCRPYLAQFLLEWEMFQAKIVEKIKIHFVFNNFFIKSWCFWDNAWKCVTAGQTTGDRITWRMRFAYKATSTHSVYIIFNAVTLQQWLNERTSIIRYTHCRPC